MWIKRNNVIVFRFSGTASASTIDRASLSAELVLKGVAEDSADRIWNALAEGVNFMNL